MNKPTEYEESIPTTEEEYTQEFPDDMPIIPEGEEGTPGDTLEDVTSIEEELLKTDWVTEAKQIPLDMVTDEQKRILIKCINKYPMNTVEQEQLAQILNQYRPAIQKVDPVGTMKNLKDNIQLVEDEKAFLELVDGYDEIQVIPFQYYVGNRLVRMKFDLYPLLDSEAITTVADNLSMFKDFSENELVTYNKIQNGETLTREEMLIRAELEEKVKRVTMENQKRTLVEYLSLQLKFHNKDSSVEDMKQVFEHIPLAYLALLFNKVQECNHLSDLHLENVFQEFD